MGDFSSPTILVSQFETKQRGKEEEKEEESI